jgi:hypothetical protein
VGGGIGITHRGIVEIEQALSNPSQPTQHFPASVNIVQIMGNVVDSQIQQGAQVSQQVQISEDSRRDMSNFLQRLTESLASVKVNEESLTDLKADMDSIKAQLGARHPKRAIIREALSSIKGVLEGAGATILAAEATKLLLSLNL